MFHVIEKEMAWRKSVGRPEGFDTLRAAKPIVAVGAEHPLEDETLMADYFRKSQYLGFYLPADALTHLRWLGWTPRRS